MLSVQNCKYKTACLHLRSNPSFQRSSRNKGCIYEQFCRTVSFKNYFLP